MIAAIENFFMGINPYFGVFAVSMVPVIELRGAIPLGLAYGLHWLWVLIISIVGNLLPAPFVIWIIRPFIEWMKKTPSLKKFGLWLDNRTKSKSKNIKKYKFWGLMLLVAIPLPGTGAWTGAMVAGIMNMRLKDAIPAILLGVIVAGIIVTLASFSVIAIF